uniref:hypothetical protein n=1 Tax=Parerythrobacter lutipelagi TaxID=1964208 RepID=UPI0010F6AAD5|nr:hypothetical protein [Parerythrobacter lutipelagi]
MNDITFQITIDGQMTALAQVHDWEFADALRACKRLHLDPGERTLKEMRAFLLETKLDLGTPRIRKLLRWQVGATDVLSSLMALLSFGGRKICSVDILCNRGTAKGFADWFIGLNTDDRKSILLNGEPQHYVLGPTSQGYQEVIETTGGAPLPSHFYIHYGDTSKLKTPPDPAFPVEIPGVAYSPLGIAVAGVRHMLRDEGPGFRCRPLAELPTLTPDSLISQNRWHLATEFTNWITAWIEETDPPQN